MLGEDEGREECGWQRGFYKEGHQVSWSSCHWVSWRVVGVSRRTSPFFGGDDEGLFGLFCFFFGLLHNGAESVECRRWMPRSRISKEMEEDV